MEYLKQIDDGAWAEKHLCFDTAYVVPKSFANDLCRKADEARQARDKAAEECGVNVMSFSMYRGDANLECYGGHADYAGDVNSPTPECRRFWAKQNYLLGLADAAYELGFTLCWDREKQKHVTMGCALEQIIREA